MYYIYNMRKTILIFLACMFRACLSVMAQTLPDTTIAPAKPTGYITIPAPSWGYSLSLGGIMNPYMYISGLGKYFDIATTKWVKSKYTTKAYVDSIATLKANLSGGNIFKSVNKFIGSGSTNGIQIVGNTDYSQLQVDSINTVLSYITQIFGDNREDLYKIRQDTGSTLGINRLYVDIMSMNTDIFKYKNFNIWHEGNLPLGTTGQSIRVNSAGNAFEPYTPTAGNSGTVTSITRGVGLVGNGTSITSTGSIVVDTTVIATKSFENSLAPKNSPAFTGVPTAPTAATGTNTTQIATTAGVRSEINSLVNKNLAGGYGINALFYSPISQAASISVDTSQVKSKAGALIDYNNQAAAIALKLNKTDTTAAFSNLVHKAGAETITGLKTFIPTTTGVSGGNVFSLNATATANNQTFSTLTINSPAVASGSFTGLSARALNVIGDISATNLTATSSITSGSLNGVSGVLLLQSNNGRIIFNSNSLSSSFIWGDVSTAPNGSKLQLVGTQPGVVGLSSAISASTSLLPALSNDKLIGVNIAPTYGTGTTAINTLPSPAYSGTASQTLTQSLVILSGGTTAAKARVSVTSGATSFSSVTLVEGGSGYAAGNVVTVTAAGITATYTLVSGNIGLTGVANYSLALNEKVLWTPTSLVTTPISNSFEYEGTRPYVTNSTGTRNALAYITDITANARTPIPVSANATMILNADYLNVSATQYTLTLPATTGFTTDGSKIITVLATGAGGLKVLVPSGYALQSGTSFATTTGTGGFTLTQGQKGQLIPIGTNSYYLQPLYGTITLY